MVRHFAVVLETGLDPRPSCGEGKKATGNNMIDIIVSLLSLLFASFLTTLHLMDLMFLLLCSTVRVAYVAPRKICMLVQYLLTQNKANIISPYTDVQSAIQKQKTTTTNTKNTNA